MRSRMFRTAIATVPSYYGIICYCARLSFFLFYAPVIYLQPITVTIHPSILNQLIHHLRRQWKNRT